ncbi:MAG: hypothetical protein KDD56_01480 [Bdellovibrionales bacterium]|nr:hypothetical protein [Bdellovibrionales bacterium]
MSISALHAEQKIRTHTHRENLKNAFEEAEEVKQKEELSKIEITPLDSGRAQFKNTEDFKETRNIAKSRRGHVYMTRKRLANI